MKVDLTVLSVALSMVVAAFSIATSLWKITKLVVAKSRAQQARIDSLNTTVRSLAEELNEVVFYLSLPEEERGKFHIRKGLRRITKESMDDYNDEHTDFN